MSELDKEIAQVLGLKPPKRKRHRATPLPEMTEDQEEQIDSLLELVPKLPSKVRTYFMDFLSGLTIKEIAQKHGVYYSIVHRLIKGQKANRHQAQFPSALDRLRQLQVRTPRQTAIDILYRELLNEKDS